MTISKREKFLGIFTVLAILIGVITQTPLFDQIKSIGSSSNELSTKIDEFKAQHEKMKAGVEIEKQYREIEDRFPAPKEGQKPEYQFSEDIDRLCKSLGVQSPTINPPERENIADVDEYQFITLSVVTRGTNQAIMKLLQGFTDKRLIIKEVNLKATLDADELITTIKVARIAKAEPIDAKKKAKN